MSDIFISYARSTEAQAKRIAEALRALGYGVWRDDELPAHRSYSEVIEERLQAARAVVVVWSADAVKSEWVQSEADRARADRKLVQLTVDGAALPMPFDRIQCADLAGWSGDTEAPGWRKVVASLVELVGGTPAAGPVAAAPPPPLPLPDKPSIAVLPFANLSGDPEQEYFADGMVEEIVSALSKFRSIFVIASGSTFAFKSKTVSPQEAARSLGVRYVLEGSVRKSANRVRISVKLMDTAEGVQIWTDRFDDTLDDIFDLQDRVALSVAAQIEPTVEQAEARRANARPTENMGGYDLYLRALVRYRTSTREGVLEARDLLDHAIALDPTFSAALALAAMCHLSANGFGWVEDVEDNRRRGVELARRAVKAAGDDAFTLAYAGIALSGLAQEHEAGLTLVRKAIAINPGSAVAWFAGGVILGRVGDLALAVEHIETSLRLDPITVQRPARASFIGMMRLRQGRFAEAVAILRDALQTVENPGAYAALASAHAHLGEIGAAREALARYHAATPAPIEDYVRFSMVDPAQQKLFLDGIALASGGDPAKPEDAA